MDITNNTNNDATVKVSGGGSGMVKGAEEILSLPAGKTISHTPKPPGPWKVNFYVGSQQTRKTVRCATDTVTLNKEGNNGFRVGG
jgi:hypothetical protein